MIVLNLELDQVYGFEHFGINFAYPKKVVNSIIEEEYLEGRERFRYKKAVILMGSNATGKTSMGKALLRIFAYLVTGNQSILFDMVSGDTGAFSIDFVNDGYILHRLNAAIDKTSSKVEFRYYSARVNRMDSYEKCVGKLEEHTSEWRENGPRLIRGAINYRFAYPEIESSLFLKGIDKDVFLKTLRAVVCTLDPSIQEVAISHDLKDTYILRRRQTEIIVQEGKLLNREVLSSGTAEGIDVAIFLASMCVKDKTFYYCDEHFSYIHSDIEKRIFGLMLDRISSNEQLIFTTHNTDMLDLNLPKHAFMFLRKDPKSGFASAISASEILKRNTDDIRNAVENDVFCSLPDDSLLDELEMGWEDE